VAPRARLLELGQEGDQAVDHPAVVDAHDPVEIGVAGLVGGAEHADAGVIDQHIDLAEVGLDRVGGAGEGGAVGDVELDEQRRLAAVVGEPLGGPRPLILAAIGDGDAHAGVAERPGDAEADARGPAGDEGDLAGPVHGASFSTIQPFSGSFQ